MANYDELMNEFPQQQSGKFISLKNVGDSYEGRLLRFEAAYEKDFNNGRPLAVLIPAIFEGKDDAGETIEQQLDCGKAIMGALQRANAQEGDMVRIERTEYQAKDGDGNPVTNSDGTARMLTGYNAEVIADTAPKTGVKKTAASAAEEINIDDIPF